MSGRKEPSGSAPAGQARGDRTVATNRRARHDYDIEETFEAGQGRNDEPDRDSKRPSPTAYPLGMVLEACPDIVQFARWGISSWREFLATASFVRSNLGISPSAWEDAVSAMGEEGAAVIVAAILQKGDAIKNPGGYLRNLAERASAGQFSLGPVLMALLRVKLSGARKLS